MLPLKQKLMVPRSSLTTTTTASVSSVMPSAARWREPKLSSMTRPSGMGKNTPALAMRRFRMMTAPSCSLFIASGMNSETNSSLVTAASIVRALVDAHELVEVRVLLEGDDGADAVARQLGGGRDHLVDDAHFLERADAANQAPLPMRMQAAPNVVPGRRPR